MVGGVRGKRGEFGGFRVMVVGGGSPAVGNEAVAAPSKPQGRKLAVGRCSCVGSRGKAEGRVRRRRLVVAPRRRRRGRRRGRQQLEEIRGKGGEGLAWGGGGLAGAIDALRPTGEAGGGGGGSDGGEMERERGVAAE